MKLYCFALATILPVLGNAQAQTPFNAQHPLNWDLGIPPSHNATDNLIFDSVASLLQHWPSTRHRNGHAIVPGIVPVGTLLYHGTTSNAVPTCPEWAATDPEHSYLFCLTTDSDCWHLTLVASRPLKVLYFDGNSAAKMVGGPMDTQDFLTWGGPVPEKTWKGERERLNDLCHWGSKFGLDGFVRMEMDFEVMLCDLTAGLEVVSFVSLAVHTTRSAPRPLPDAPQKATVNQPWTDEDHLRDFEVVRAGSWHNAYPGDPRVVLDLTRYFSFYDISLAPSLVPIRENQTRGEYRVKGLAKKDLDVFVTALEGALSTRGGTSGIDWQAHIRVLIKRYTDRLELTARLLRNSDRSAAQAQKVFTQLRVMLTPYTLASAVPLKHSTETSWAEPVYRLCATTPVGFISASADIFAQLTYSEKVVLRSIEGTNKEICRVLVKMWAHGVLAEIPIRPIETNTRTHLALMDTWQKDLEGLMSWLSWAAWVKCTPACSDDELCYLPTYPYLNKPQWPPAPGPRDPSDEDQEREEKAVKVLPEPRCIRALAPFSPLF